MHATGDVRYPTDRQDWITDSKGPREAVPCSRQRGMREKKEQRRLKCCIFFLWHLAKSFAWFLFLSFPYLTPLFFVLQRTPRGSPSKRTACFNPLLFLACTYLTRASKSLKKQRRPHKYIRQTALPLSTQGKGRAVEGQTCIMRQGQEPLYLSSPSSC